MEMKFGSFDDRNDGKYTSVGLVEIHLSKIYVMQDDCID